MPAQVPDWLKTGKISSDYLGHVYSALMKRERTRADSRRGSRQIIYPPRFREKEPKQGVMRKLHLKSSSRDTNDLSPAEEFYSVRSASTPQNQDRNRYSDIEPYDRSRVLVGATDRTSGRYLNASWVREAEGKAWWIAAQAPLFNTTHAFLSLFTTLQPESLRLRTIVQLTPMAENGIRKADQYIPETPASQPLLFYPENECGHLPAIEVSLLSQEAIPQAGCLSRTVSLKLVSSSRSAGETFVINHISYEKWPDHSIPEDPDELGTLAQVVSRINGPSAPILVHCSAGVGRTGTFIAISSLLRFYSLLPESNTASPTYPLYNLFPLPERSPLGPLPPALGDDPVAREVDSLREQRTTMVQRPEQLGIVYQVLVNAMARPPKSK